ncbi:metallophosphoesterase [Halomonas sp. 18H]|nr:metallophosphoesterase [Halomonas sp. 18H]MCW4149484.1 metallophosphoesterase [Halomonas sp. 18H]
MRLIQVSDCHLHADPAARSRTGNPYRQWCRVLDEVARYQPDMLLVTGDISQDDSRASYVLAERELARLACPWYWLPGNHDVPALMQQFQAPQARIELGAVDMLLLNTQVVGEAHGRLGPERLAALDAELSRSQRAPLVAMHHPPLAVGSAWIDALGLVDAAEFWEVLAAHEPVAAIFCGHVHQAVDTRQALPRGEVPVHACPSTSDQFLPGSRAFAVDSEALPGFRIIDLPPSAANGAVSTRVVRVPLP